MSPANPETPGGGRPQERDGAGGASRNRRRRPRRSSSNREAGESAERREGAGAKPAGRGEDNSGRPAGRGEGGSGRPAGRGEGGASRSAGGERKGGSNERREKRPVAHKAGDVASEAPGEGRGRNRRRSGRGARTSVQQAAFDETIPDLHSWAFSERGYTVWTARMRISPPGSGGCGWRTYIVDVHVDELAVDRHYLSELLPLLELSVAHVQEEAGVAELAGIFARAAEEATLPDAATYLARLPEEATLPGTTPTQTALYTLVPLDLDTDQETIDLLNEGRVGETRPARA